MGKWVLAPIRTWMRCFLKLYRHTLWNNAGRYRRTQRACTGLYEGVILLDDRIHSTAASSTDRLGGQIATINHHLSADLQATCDSLQGVAGRYCTQFPSDSLYSSLAGSVSELLALFLSDERRRCFFFICSWPDALSRRSLGNDLDADHRFASRERRGDWFCCEWSLRSFKSGSYRSVCYYHSSVSLPHWTATVWIKISHSYS